MDSVDLVLARTNKVKKISNHALQINYKLVYDLSITNQNNILTNSSMASLKRMICNGSFLKDISRKNHFNKCLNRYSDYGTCDHDEWVDYFNVMPHIGSGIMSHINIMM